MEQDYPGGRNLVREALKLRGILEQSMDIMLSSLSASSYKQYETCFKKWWLFCSKKNINPFQGLIQDILTFLTEIFNTGAAHSTVNCYRSAISLLVGPDIAEDERMKRFFKGLSMLRPSKPKYDSTWDPKIVLDFFTTLPKSEDLSLKQLTMKLICLLALVTGHRMQTFSLIRIINVEEKEKSIVIKIPDRIKTTGPNRNQPTLILPFFRRKKVCAATLLKVYLEKTKDIRGNEEFLYISYKPPFKAVTAQTLSRWTKETLGNSGVDTSIFTAHSTRHASTSAAKRKGIDLDTLRRTAGWTKTSNTFVKFYNLNLNTNGDTFAKAILNS